jgi:epoxyqueuosine reductase
LRSWIEAGFHGSMSWMEERVDERAAPSTLWSDVKAIVMLGLSYAPEHNVLEDITKKDRGVISAYAQSRDYHDFIKAKLKRLARFMVETKAKGQSPSQRELEPAVKVFVDTAPVMEKALAQAAGLGWQGKHTVLVSREQGSWMFLGAIYANFEIPEDQKHGNHCGSCTRCLSICPTDAFPAPYQLDSTKCIAYLTIEYKGSIDRSLRARMGNRVFGCDDCLAICPWNRFAKQSAALRPFVRNDLSAPALKELSTLDDERFRKHFSGTPIKRTGRDRFLRNVLIAMGNSGDDAMVSAIAPHLNDASALVRGAAIWALAQLVSEAEFENLRAHHLPHEVDGTAREEWRLGKAL